MKPLFFIVVVFAFSIQINAQNILPFEPGVVFDPISDCLYCEPIEVKDTGFKTGIGFGLVKELTPRVDLTTHLSYQYWRHTVNYQGFHYYAPYAIEEENHLVNISLGQRFHFVKFKSSSFFTGTNFNFHTYLNERERNFGLSIEPSLGWKKDLGKNNELFMSAGYDKPLTSYEKSRKYYPGRLGINFGFNFILKKKVEETKIGE